MKSKNFKLIILVIIVLSLSGCNKKPGDEVNVQTVKDGTETIGEDGVGEADEYLTEDTIQEDINGNKLDISQLVQAKNNVEKSYEKLVGILSDKLDNVILNYDSTKDTEYVLPDIELITEGELGLTESVGDRPADGEIELEIIDGNIGEDELELEIIDGDIDLEMDSGETSEIQIEIEEDKETAPEGGGIEEGRDKYEVDFEDLEMMAVLDDIQAGFNQLDTIRAQIETISTKLYSQGYTKQSEIDMDTNLLNNQISSQVESLIEEYK